jgi:hypothetical protein
MSISPVQRFGIRVMLGLESRERTQASVDALKRSLMSQDPITMAPELFPEMFEPVETTDFDNVPEGAETRVVNAIDDKDVDSFLAMMGVVNR